MIAGFKNMDYHIQADDRNYTFKSSVPTFYFHDNDGKLVKPMVFSNHTNVIDYSFSKEVCKEHSLLVLDNEQITSTLVRFNLKSSTDYYTNFLTLKSFLSNTPNAPIMPYKILMPASNYLKSVANPFLREIECFIDVKFNKINSLKELSQDAFSFSLCITPENVIANGLGKQAYTTVADATKGQSSDQYNIGFAVYDGNVNSKVQPSSSPFQFNENTVKHEIMHILGLGHSNHFSLSNNKKYRSIVEDIDDVTSLPLSRQCIKKHQELEDRMECLKPPVTLMPVDVKGLISIWGPSHDDSSFCQDIRRDFVESYSDYMHVSNDEIFTVYL